MRRKLVVGNWKMHGSVERVGALLDGIKLASEVSGMADVAVCPPFIYLQQAITELAGTAVSVGAQNLSQYDEGAYTGEISGSMLADMGCQYVIVGHSERRSLFAETDACVAGKFLAAQRLGLTPILCLGENLEQRQSGDALMFVAKQLEAVIDVVGIQAFANSVVAYEPIWAIGTGMTASPEQAQEVHAHLREVVAGQDIVIAEGLQVLYGGSVNAGNAVELFEQEDIDGALVGGASLKVEDFSVICRA